VTKSPTLPVNLPRPLQPRALTPPVKGDGSGLQLIINYADGHWVGYPLEKPIIKVGRRPDNDIILPDQCVSGHHAEFRRLPDQSYELADCGSYNGTSVNGARIESRKIGPGDFIIFGILEAVVENKKGSSEAVNPAAAEEALKLTRELEQLRAEVAKLSLEKREAQATLETLKAELQQAVTQAIGMPK